MKKYFIIGIIAVIAAVVLIYLFWRKDLSGRIVLPYITHQKPHIDPHLPASNPLADNLDEVLFDGLFNVSATPSGITFEDGLGSFLGIDNMSTVSIRLNTDWKWHSSYKITYEEEKYTITAGEPKLFSAADLRFTLQRIKRLGTLSPDYVLVSQAVRDLEFTGPDEENVIRFSFSKDRIWKEDDIKEILSFKILPEGTGFNTSEYTSGSGPYLKLDIRENVHRFRKTPESRAKIEDIELRPFIDNSTFTTEIKNNNINVLLQTPFGSLSPILANEKDFFYKSNISSTFFAVVFNTQRLPRDQRVALRNLIDRDTVVNRFFKIGTKQQRHIADYKGNRDNYDDYINYSLFPTSTIYVEEEIVIPDKAKYQADLSLLPDTVKIVACQNYGYREEYRELIEIFNDPSLFSGRIKATAVQNDIIASGKYDAALIAFSGYRSDYLFDLYKIFLREPDLTGYNIHLLTDHGGAILPESFKQGKNLFNLDAGQGEEVLRLLQYIHNYMSSREIGDRLQYSIMINTLENELALGSWLFSMPSLAYFTTQFDQEHIDLYGKASQLSTVEKWQEKAKE
jgi:hypothetical protein